MENNSNLLIGATLMHERLLTLYALYKGSMELSVSEEAEMEKYLALDFTSETNDLRSGFGTMINVILKLPEFAMKSRKITESRMRMLEAAFEILRPGRKMRLSFTPQRSVTMNFYRR